MGYGRHSFLPSDPILPEDGQIFNLAVPWLTTWQVERIILLTLWTLMLVHWKEQVEHRVSIDSITLKESMQRLFPDLELDEVLAELLLERARKNLIKYRTMVRHFEAKYDTDFQAFRQRVLDSEPPFDIEQDYFDWEMAVTGIDDMQAEIMRLECLHEL